MHCISILFMTNQNQTIKILMYIWLFALTIIWVTWRVSCKMQELLTLRERLGSPSVFGEVRFTHLFFLVFCFVFFCFVCPVMCLACPMLQMSLDCPFLITPSGFSNFIFYFVAGVRLPQMTHFNFLTVKEQLLKG
jgi:hypothetical protein